MKYTAIAILLFLSSCNVPNDKPKSVVENQPLTSPEPDNIKRFKPVLACSLPLKSSNSKFHRLAGGTWTDTFVDGKSYGFGCKSGKMTQSEMNLFESDGNVVRIEYAAFGDSLGAKYITIDYWVDSARDVPNELQLRKEFVDFVSDLMSQSLSQPIPPKCKEKLLNLDTYANIGVRTDEMCDAGEGVLRLTRNRNPNGSVVYATAKIEAGKKENP